MAVSYTIGLMDELLDWLMELDHPDQPLRKTAQHWLEELRPFADEYRIRETNEARAYERGYRAGQLRSLQYLMNEIRTEKERVNADAELSAIRVEVGNDGGVQLREIGPGEDL